MNEPVLKRLPHEQLSGSGHTFGTSRLPSVTNPILSKRVCFYKSGDPQFNGLRMVINNRTFKTFDALLDSLSKKVPLPFGVRNITTPRGVHAVSSLEELEDGKSYICSDHRKVKPINLAMARKKPPPWYHARPVSSRRRTVQQGRLYPGNKLQDLVVVRTPKKLLIFRNGDPSTQCVVVLQKKSTSTFESILRYVSELMQFRVAKLHTPDGKRVDGLPALIMCSGTVVAAGREKFKPANYNSQKSVLPTRMRNSRRGVRRLKALNQKKRSFALKPRLLSPSSEKYIVNQIHTSIAESAYSIHTNSHEMESSHLLESVAESEENFVGDGAEGQESLLPTDDDIEKSFRVNQDGSMTVEMKVRLTIKEEETIHWTTTLSRSSVSNQLSEDCLPAPEPGQQISFPESDHMDLRPPTVPCKDISTNNDICYEDPTSLNKGPNNKNSLEEDDIKTHGDFLPHLRSASPGQKQIRTKQASVESVTSLSADGLYEDIIGSYFREHIENGDITEQYCMVKQTNSKPVPKPRRVGSVEANSCNITAYKTAGLTEILQVDSSGEEVKETVMHIYEQQTCQDNFLANICSQAMSTSVHFSRPATCDTGHDSFNCSFQPEPCRPSTASEHASLWRSESISFKSDLTSQSQTTGSTHTQPLSQKLTKSQIKEKAKLIKKERKSSPMHKVKRLKSPGNKTKEGINKKGKPLSSARFISNIYGSESKPNKDMTDMKKRKQAATAKNTAQKTKRKSRVVLSQPKAKLTQQATLKLQKERTKSLHNTKSVPLPIMSNSGTNGYVEDWLEKAQPKPTFYLEGENQELIDSEKLNLENDPCLMSVAEKVKCLKEKSKTPDSCTVPLPDFTRKGSVRQKIKSFENKSEDRQQCETNSPNDCLLLDTQEGVFISNNLCSENNVTTSPADKSATIVVQFEESSNSLLMDLPPPPPESLLESFSAHGMEASASSSPLYRLSSVSDIHPLSTSPTSDRAISPTNRTIVMAPSIKADNSSELRNAPLQRAPSIKRAPLVSNLSLERKMSLKKACLDEYTIPKESTSLSIYTVDDNELGKNTDVAAERLQSKSTIDTIVNQPFLSSASPASLTADHRKHIEQSNEDSVSPKLKLKKVKLVNSPSPERKPIKKPSEIMKTSSKIPSINNSNRIDKKASPNVARRKSTSQSASPASEKKEILRKSKLLQKSSPYSQSLDLASPPVKQKTSVKPLQRNLSTDSALAPNKTSRKMSTQRKTEQGLDLKQSNKTHVDKPAQIQGSTKATMEENLKTDQRININKLVTEELVRGNQSTNQELDKHILDAIKTNENEDEMLNETGIGNLGQLHYAHEVNKQYTEQLLAVSEKCETKTEMCDSQCYANLTVNVGVSCSVDDTATDIDELSFSEEDVPTETTELMVIVEEPLSDKEKKAFDDWMSKKQLTENDVEINLENDSGNDNSSCSECVETISTNYEITSIEEELCSDENEMKTEEETALLSLDIRKKCNESIISQDEKIENIAKKLCDEVISQSVAKRVTCLEEKDANGVKGSPVTMSPLQTKAFLVSDGGESPTDSAVSQVKSGTRSAPQSSLSFSYDSNCVITKQPEGNRVKSIREMFLAKSVTDTQLSQKQNLADMTEFRAETSASGGYQSQTSSELSSGEDDSSRKSISKGFVMKTIERLYGKKESLTQVNEIDRPLSAHKQKKKVQNSIFSPFHAARSKTVSELSYFNSSNALDTLTEATKCMAFNAQVVPGDSVLNDHGGWLLHDNTVLRKSVSDPVAISQNISTQEDQDRFKDTEEKTPYLLFKTDSEDEQKSPFRKCTYFSLPHASDSEVVQEESVVKGDVKGDCCEPKSNSEGTALRSEKNGKITGVLTDFKVIDNKVHPLVETPSDGEAIIVQPLRGQGVLNRRLPEPDMMDFLYNFCGEHCPIL